MITVIPSGALALLTAGDVDDNLNFGEFLVYEALPNGPGNVSGMPELALADRVTVHVLDGTGTALPNAWVRITATDAPQGSFQDLSVDLQAGTDGLVRFFPTFDGLSNFAEFEVIAGAPGSAAGAAETSLVLADLDARREFSITVANATAAAPVALDVMLVVDTTGSMEDEIRYLADEFATIVEDITAANEGLDFRYGLVIYRDEGDTYTNFSYGFTKSMENMQGWLSEMNADGGMDFPEAMDAALLDGVRESWRGGNTARLLFLVADAPPHKAGYAPMIEAVREARAAGVHIFPLAASGVDTVAEYIMRASAVLTQGRYLFLTDDSGVGGAHAVPSAQCYVVTSLTSLFDRVIGGELTGARIEPTQDEIVRTVGNYTAGQCESNGGVIRPYAAMWVFSAPASMTKIESPAETPSSPVVESDSPPPTTTPPPAPTGPAADEPSAGPPGGADTDTTSGATVANTNIYLGAVPRTPVEPGTEFAEDDSLEAPSPPAGGDAPPPPQSAGYAPTFNTATPAGSSLLLEVAGAAAALAIAALLGAFAAQHEASARRRATEIWKRR